MSRKKVLTTTQALALGAAVTATVWAAVRRARRIDLRGKVVLITGGGRGLGYEIARQFADRGCKLAICGRDRDVIERAVANLRARGVDVMGRGCDAADRSQIEAFVADVIARHGAIDVLVNNAAECFVGPAAEVEDADLELALRNILWVQARPTMVVLPHMRRRRFGRIVNVTSLGGKVPIPHQPVYCAGKYAATGWSETIATELRKDGIHVSTVYPPPLDDGAPLHVHYKGRVEDEFRWFTRTLTSPFRATRPERAARAVVDAALHGDTERAVSFGSWLAARVYALVPDLASRAMSAVEQRVLPPPEPGRPSPMRFGYEIVSDTHDPRVRSLAEKARADERRYQADGVDRGRS